VLKVPGLRRFDVSKVVGAPGGVTLMVTETQDLLSK
jgi:hypothetical protein